MRTTLHSLVVAGSVLLFAGCNKETSEPVDLGYDYYPTTVGSWVEYQVDSLWRDDYTDVLDSVQYRLLVRVEEAYTDMAGRPAFRVIRSTRDAEGQWVPRDVWTTTVSSTAAELTEENQRRLKLSFPVRAGRAWNINVFNTEDELSVAYRDLGQPLQLDSAYFPETVLVRNTVPPNQVDNKDFEEHYARNVGMVRKYQMDMNTQMVVVNGQFVIRKKGWRLKMQAISFGND